MAYVPLHQKAGFQKLLGAINQLGSVKHNGNVWEHFLRLLKFCSTDCSLGNQIDSP